MAQYMSMGPQGSNTRGDKHQLLMDRTAIQDCEIRHPNLCIACTNYRKAYNSIPYTCILKCLELYNINRTLRAFISNPMGLWKTNLEVNSKPTAQVNIKYGIYQGDALSPLLFCTGLIPLSYIITKSGYGSKVGRPSSTSSTWTTSSCLSGLSETSTR